MIMRLAHLPLVILLAAACGPPSPQAAALPPPTAASPAPSASAAASSAAPVDIVRAFWRSMNAGDVAKVRALVALPMAWGKGCEPILTREALDQQLAEDFAGGGAGRAKDPEFVQELHDRWDAHDEALAVPFERLAGTQRACPQQPAAATEALRRRRHRIYVADGNLTRLSMVDGAWRVTGWSSQADQ